MTQNTVFENNAFHINKKGMEFKVDLDVLLRIAITFHENRSLKKTHLFFVSRTNWHAFSRYLKWLESKNFVKCNINGKDVDYQLTESGREMVDALLKFQDVVKKTLLK